MTPAFPHNIRPNLRQPTGQRLSNIRVQQKKSIGPYIMRKVWYHQIWIQNNLGFMVSGLIFIPSPLGPMHASRSAPAWAKIRRHRAPGLVAAAWSAVLPHESLESRHLISSPLSRSSKSSALSHSAAWCSSLKKLQKLQLLYYSRSNYRKVARRSRFLLV